MTNSHMKYTKAWLPFLVEKATINANTPEETALLELKTGLPQLGDNRQPVLITTNDGDGYTIETTQTQIRISGGRTGLLYGAYRALMELKLTGSLTDQKSKPVYKLRMLNHWDNMDGTVERGYAGESLFFKDNKFRKTDERLHFYGRMLASVGINTMAINNVNVIPPANKLISEDMLPSLKKFADILRIYGIRLLISVDFISPASNGLATSDPLETEVKEWWIKHIEKVYHYIPDLAGLLVKADSEHQKGPSEYGRSNVQGANMLAEALAPHGGVLIWRSFVYNCEQDWRDKKTDRPCAAYSAFADQDGLFRDNVILQVKNGPSDFQVREPLSPLLLAALKTNKALEVQITQEYTGHQIDIYYMREVWREIFEDLPVDSIHAISAVANTGLDESWTGNDLALANLYTYGRMAWNPDEMKRDIALEWAQLTFGSQRETAYIVAGMLNVSRSIYQQYVSPLGLGWMVEPHDHYRPSPEGYEYSKWGTYLRTTCKAVGTDRTSGGSCFLSQYPETLRKKYEKPETCPDDLLLFFHRLEYSFRMKDGRMLIQRIYDDHFQGAERAEKLLADWDALEGTIEPEIFRRVRERLCLQVENAKEWRDVVNNYFYRFSGIDDAKHRKIY